MNAGSLDLDRAAASVLARYDFPVRSITALGNAGGFSGARLWRVMSTSGERCLKAWPPTVSLDRLQTIHGWMDSAYAAGLKFIPQVWRAEDNSSVQHENGRCWDLSDWMPGRADFEQRPTPQRMAAAASALARLHRVWAEHRQALAPCPAIERRLIRLADWDAAIRSGWRPPADRLPDALPEALDVCRDLLEPLRHQPQRVHPCLGDVWHDHVFFDDEHVSGIIDFGAARIDTPAVDLARMVGSLAATDDGLFEWGLRTYRSIAPLDPGEVWLVHVLDFTGTALGLLTWLLWLDRDGRTFDDPAAAKRRMEALAARLHHLRQPRVPLI